MKLNKITLALAAMALVGCSSEDVSDFSANQTIDENGLVQLSPNFVIAGVGQDDATTRTHWDWAGTPGASALVNQFLPIYTSTATFGSTLDKDADLTAQAVGLCWLGNGAVGTDVYTNYEFYHFGWLNNGAAKAEFECGKLSNGSLYSDITMAGGVAGAEAVPATDFTLPTKSATAGLNYNTGIYKTDNKAIFGGDYIVYYPYNEDFKNAGTIPAKGETKFNPAATTLTDASVGQATFRYSAPVAIEGGDQAADFGLYNLSTLVQLRVASAATPAPAIGINMDQIVLYSPSKQLLQQANLAADKIAARKTGTELYASTEGTKTITATFAAPTAVLQTDATPTSAYITVLPTTVEDLVVLVHGIDAFGNGKWAKVDMPNTVFEAGKAKRLDITVAAADFKAEFVAVDLNSLSQALIDARNAVIADPTATPTIEVIGDITIDNPVKPFVYNINAPQDPNITITGDAIIVPEDVTLNVETNIVSDLRLLGKSCCTGTNGAILNITNFNGASATLNNVTMEPTKDKTPTAAKNPTVNYNGPATIAAGKTFDAQAGNIVVNNAVSHKGDLNIAEGVTVTVNAGGKLDILGGNVVNDGTIEVKKAGTFNMKNSDGGSVWTDGKRMTNNGTFIHNVDAVVGTAVQFMKGAGEYRCRVDKQKALDDAYMQWTRCSVIEMVVGANSYDLGNACQHKVNDNDVLQYIDIEVNNNAPTTFDDNSGTTSDAKNIQIGNLTVKANGANALTINYPVKTKKQRELTVNGNITASADIEFKESKKITVTGNVDINNGATLIYRGGNKIVEGLKVNGNITVTGATFNANFNDAILIECKNFSLAKDGATAATATFGNRTNGNTQKTMEVKGTINNGAGCTFTITPATGANLLAWITCYEVTGTGTFAGDPTVVMP